ncbi:unnamed protein product, partial [Polarella glacialis]
DQLPEVAAEPQLEQSASLTQSYAGEFDNDSEEEYDDDHESIADEDEDEQTASLVEQTASLDDEDAQTASLVEQTASLDATMPKMNSDMEFGSLAGSGTVVEEGLDSSALDTTNLADEENEAEEADLPSSSQRYNLEITIVKARGLRDADWAPFSGKSDPYCTCEVKGKPATKLQTPTINDQLDPEWNFEGPIAAVGLGDSLLFVIHDDDAGKADDLLAELLLPADKFLPSGFEGELQLTASGDVANEHGPHVTIKISVTSAE